MGDFDLRILRRAAREEASDGVSAEVFQAALEYFNRCYPTQFYRAPRSDEEREALERALSDVVENAVAGLARPQKNLLIDRLRSRVAGLDKLQPALDDLEVTDIQVNAEGQVFLTRDGINDEAARWYPGMRYEDPQEVQVLMQGYVAEIGREVNEEHPLVDAWLPDGSRVNMVVAPLSPFGPVITIRKSVKTRVRIRLRDLLANGTMSLAVLHLLTAALRARANILVVGEPEAGKTTLVSGMLEMLPWWERTLIVGDALETLPPSRMKNCVRMATVERPGESFRVNLGDMRGPMLRMSPRQIVVEEIRIIDGAVYLDICLMGMGRNITTLHAPSLPANPRAVELRVMMMAAHGDLRLPPEMAREAFHQAVHLLMFAHRFDLGRQGRVFRVTSLVEVNEEKGFLPLTEFDSRSMTLRFVAEPKRLAAMAAAQGHEMPGLDRLRLLEERGRG